MGQYFLLINLDKKEYIDPFKLGGGYKLWEWMANFTIFLPFFLLRKSTEGGGGDYHGRELKNLGRWAGDRVMLVGDYDESGLYDLAEKEFKEISDEIRMDFVQFLLWAELDVVSREKRALLKEFAKSGLLKKEEALKIALNEGEEVML